MSSTRPHPPCIVAILSALFALCGCQNHFSIATPAPPTVAPGLYTQDNFNEDNTAYKQALTAGANFNADAAKQARNNMAYGLMADIEVVYGSYYNHLFTTQGGTAISMDALTFGLSSAASIATNAATKTIFSALGSGISGVGLSVQKNLFAQQSFGVIGLAMQTRRDKIRIAIIAGLNTDVSTYPVWAARRDLVAYFNAGTLPGGLQELQEEAGATGAATAAAAAANAPTTKPAPPTILVAAPGDGQATLSWQAPAGATSYNLYYSDTNDVTTANGTKVAGIATNSTTQTGLNDGTPYYFIVTAVNSVGESDASSQASATPAAPPAVGAGGKPVAPTSVSTVPGNGQVSLVWQASGGAVSYNLYYSQSSDMANAKEVTGITGTSTVQKGLNNGTPYFFTVTAVNAAGESPASTTISATPSAPAPDHLFRAPH